MTKIINQQVLSTPLSGIRAVNDFVTVPAEQMITLAVGEIDLPTPLATRQAGRLAIEQNQTKYTENKGILALRQAIAADIMRGYNIEYLPETEIMVTVGAGQAIDLVIRSLVNPGDEVIVIAPAYPAYIQAILLVGARPVIINTGESYFRLKPEQLAAAITSKTKLVILNYPNNPTGVVLSRDELRALSVVIKQHDLFVLTDDIYKRLAYDFDDAPSIASVFDMKKRTVIVNGLSKSHSMTGWRIGYVAAPAYFIQEMNKVQQASVGCASSISQLAAITALTVDQDTPRQFITIFKKRRDYVLNRLDQMQLSYVRPEGAFYVFVDISRFGLSALDFVKYAITRAKLVMVHGSAFTEYGEGYVRISFASDLATLALAMDRLALAIAALENTAG
ncbi:pyridoxal phosphate-dependent aminotransferase [Leuconostoc rapi]|uniref:pyridoxal phosphate-dependent aminotransferase n=1 Tax=Leuconostoc rapi TaxID=1406906 RepID=UPI0019593A14|nr:aminotransferase class I/II-fold pyridoxal phosphate-dependent enzyme [Leuconostoc rapi]MBM7435058.1 aminotransferase [Leuconostoc rapi]